MKKAFFCLAVILLNGCIGVSHSRQEEPPRREFKSLEDIDITLKEPFVVNEFTSDGKIFRKESRYFSTALFLSDIGILEDTTKEQFERYADILFSNFPDDGVSKEIVIPNLSKSQETDIEKNAYLFITKAKDKDDRVYYLMESNIPIGSIYAQNYDGYVIKLDTGFHKNKIPARWTSIMNFATNGEIILYKGIAYPSKSAPLIFTGTGIGSDARMNSIMSGTTAITDTKNALNETVKKALETTQAEDQRQVDSMKFLEKATNISLSAYSYIDSLFDDAKKYFFLAKEVEIDIPGDIMGSRYKELEKIMDYLINKMNM